MGFNHRAETAAAYRPRELQGDCSKTPSRRRQMLVCFPVVAVTLVVPAAQSQTISVTDPIVVSASRLPMPRSATSSSTTVITREEILARSPASLLSILETVPGIHINRVGGNGGTSSVFIRGADPNFTLFLIDGVQVNDPTDSRGGTFDLSAVNPASVERIEIVRGPLSSVYGSQALGGVVNIITREGDGSTGAALSGSVGSLDYGRADASVTAPIAELGNVSLTAGYYHAGSGTAGTRLESKDVTGKAQLTLAGDTAVGLFGRFAAKAAERFPDDSGGPRLAVRRQTETRDAEEGQLGIDIARPITGWWNASAKGSFYRSSNQLVTPGVAPGLRDPFGIPAGQSDDTLERGVAVLANRFDVTKDLKLTVGGDVKHEHGESQGFLNIFGARVPTSFELEQTTYGAFVEARYDVLPSVTVDVALRADKAEGIDTKLSPRVGVVYRPADTGTTLRASWGEGFKLPSFFALANPFVGNPNLQPETSRGMDVGAEQVLFGGRATVSATLFRNKYFNLIDFDAGPPPRLVNRSEVLSQGFELAGTATPITSLDLSLFVQYAATEIEGTGEQLRSRPRWRGGGTVRWAVKDDVSLHWDSFVVGRTRDSSIPTGDVKLGSYVVSNIGVSWQVTEQWRIFGSIENLFDASYEEAVGFPSSGISGRVGSRIAF
jgi:vitamin B12 transporter